eukprot:6013528-Pleurochrysis_carterae.AAC.1
MASTSTRLAKANTVEHYPALVFTHPCPLVLQQRLQSVRHIAPHGPFIRSTLLLIRLGSSTRRPTGTARKI